METKQFKKNHVFTSGDEACKALSIIKNQSENTAIVLLELAKSIYYGDDDFSTKFELYKKNFNEPNEDKFNYLILEIFDSGFFDVFETFLLLNNSDCELACEYFPKIISYHYENSIINIGDISDLKTMPKCIEMAIRPNHEIVNMKSMSKLDKMFLNDIMTEVLNENDNGLTINDLFIAMNNHITGDITPNSEKFDSNLLIINIYLNRYDYKIDLLSKCSTIQNAVDFINITNIREFDHFTTLRIAANIKRSFSELCGGTSVKKMQKFVQLYIAEQYIKNVLYPTPKAKEDAYANSNLSILEIYLKHLS